MVRRCSLNRSFNRRLVSPMCCKLQRLTLNHVDENFSVTGLVRFNKALFTDRGQE